MTLTPVVTPVLSVSLSVQAVLAFIQAIVPYKPRPEKIANYFAAIGSAIPALATIWGLPLYPAAWNVSWTVVAIVMTALAVTPPLVGLIEAKCRKKSQIFETNRFAGHLATNLGGAVAATVLVWMGHSVNGFGTFTNNFTDKAALNCVLPMTILANFAFVRWQQVNECPDLDGRIKRGEEWEPALTGFSLKHAHQLANLVFLIAVTFSATTTLLYLFAFAVKQAKSSHPLQFSWQIGVAMGLSLIFFYACGLKWSRQHRAVYLTFLTGTPAALGAVLVWLALLDHGTARNVVAFSIAIGGYLLYAVEAVLASRDSGEKLELYYFATTIFALVLMLMVGALYIFK